MSTEKIWHYFSESSTATERLGEAIGGFLRGGEIIELASDVGGGKTTFVRGLARGMGSKDHVASPTFTVSREYQGSPLKLFHFDFYRLSEGGMVAAELQDYLGDKNAVIAIEWADIITDVLPRERLSLRITSLDEMKRDIECYIPAEYHYIEEALVKIGAHQ